jgi:CHAT domain-containing protein
VLLAGGISFGERSRETGKREDTLPSVPLFGQLNGTESEVNDLQARFRRAFPDARAPNVLDEDRATKQAILAVAPSYRFIHLATHGFFADKPEKSALPGDNRAAMLRSGLPQRGEASQRNPGLLSGLVFAGVNRLDRRPEETILTALEAAQLDLHKTELLVLSACETGLGRVADGEGVLGLQRAFQLAGAKTCVTSLWKVDDTATQLLMKEFYTNLWQKKMTKIEALRGAQLAMIHRYDPYTKELSSRALDIPAGDVTDVRSGSPFYWAAFVLSGDWR